MGGGRADWDGESGWSTTPGGEEDIWRSTDGNCAQGVDSEGTSWLNTCEPRSPLTTYALFLVQSPPAATHRFQTLQKYLMGQLQLIAELGGPSAAALLANVSTEVESRVLKSKIQNTFAPLRRDEPVTLTQADAARMRPAKGRPGPDPDSMVEVENYNGKMSFDSKRSRRKSVGMDLRNGPSRLSVADGPNGISPQVREFPPSMPHAQGMRSTTMPMPLPSSASAINFPHARHPQDGGDFRSASAASYNPVAFPRGDPGPIPDGKPVRPFSFAMWAGRTRSSSNASQDGSRGGIFKGRFGMGSGRSEASDMTGGGGSAWGGSGSMMNMQSVRLSLHLSFSSLRSLTIVF